MEITHKEFEADYFKGFARGKGTAKKFGKDFAIKQFNSHYPPLEKTKSMADYYYGKGYLDGLAEIE